MEEMENEGGGYVRAMDGWELINGVNLSRLESCLYFLLSF